MKSSMPHPFGIRFFYGCQRLPISRKRETLETLLHDVLKPNMTILSYDEQVAEWHAKERARLTSLEQMPTLVDGQIAAIGKVNGLILVTRNTSDFNKFSELKLENWYVK
jgi:tRNA(fMet)-specific endonuclease VapC